MAIKRADRSRPWNHNIHYHELVLRAVPVNCQRALDVGCGTGLLLEQLATRCRSVVGIDVDRDALAQAAHLRERNPRIELVEGDVMTYPFPAASFDFIAAVASLHHLPLRPALARFRDLLKPGGVLVVIGLHRSRSLADFATNAAAVPASWILRSLRGWSEPPVRTQDPHETLEEIRSACGALLPGAELRRLLLFRYSLVWRKP